MKKMPKYTAIGDIPFDNKKSNHVMLSENDKWSDYTTSNPRRDTIKAILTSDDSEQLIILSKRTLEHFIKHPDVLDSQYLLFLLLSNTRFKILQAMNNDVLITSKKNYVGGRIKDPDDCHLIKNAT